MQAGFNIKSCKTCGMMFTVGLESDEKLHSAFHSHSLKGIRFQARPCCSECLHLYMETCHRKYHWRIEKTAEAWVFP